MQICFIDKLCHHFNSNEQGVGLIEVLVALFLLAIAVLGYGALHINSVKLMDNANKTTHALLAFQNLTEQVRQTPEVLPVYQQVFANLSNTSIQTAPSFGCGLLANQSASFCNATQLAQVNAHLLWQQLHDVGINIGLMNCGQLTLVSVNSNCVVMAWGDTNPIVGNDATQDCLFALSANRAEFHQQANCLMLAVQ